MFFKYRTLLTAFTKMQGLVAFSCISVGAYTEIDHSKDFCLKLGLALHKTITNLAFKCCFHANALLEDLLFVQQYKIHANMVMW